MASKKTKTVEEPKIGVRVASDELCVGGIMAPKKKGTVLNLHTVVKLKKATTRGLKDVKKPGGSLYAHLLGLKAIEEFPIEDPATDVVEEATDSAPPQK